MCFQCICSTRQEDGFPVVLRFQRRIGSLRIDRGPVGSKAAGDFAIGGCRSQFPLAAIVVRWNVPLFQDGEHAVSYLAVLYSQPPAIAVGGCQIHDRVQLTIQRSLIAARVLLGEGFVPPSKRNGCDKADLPEMGMQLLRASKCTGLRGALI